jgi:hypothetical protein
MSDSPVPLALSVKGLQRLEQLNHHQDFAFVVGAERYLCPSFVAEFLSPRVSSLRSQDITVDEFSIETEDPAHQFGTLLSIGFGREVSLSQRELTFVRSVFGELGNRELFELTLNHQESRIEEELKARLNFLSKFEFAAICDCESQSDVGLVASHFYDLSVSDFDHVSPSVLEAILRHPGLVVQDEDSVFDVVHRRSSADLSYFGLLELVRFEFLSEDCITRAFDFIGSSFDLLSLGIWLSLRARLTVYVTPSSQPSRFKPLPAMDSRIVSATPELFSVFRSKTLKLLYRGSRDGLRASDFHDRCDGHPNTISLIQSTNDCVFGGHTPVAWTSRSSEASDPSLTSFLFTIKNPHNLRPQLFKQKTKENAIGDFASYGPRFGGSGDADLSVYTQFRTPNSGTYSDLGKTYANDTGIPGKQVLTGAQTFGVEEIEVFEVI